MCQGYILSVLGEAKVIVRCVHVPGRILSTSHFMYTFALMLKHALMQL